MDVVSWSLEGQTTWVLYFLFMGLGVIGTHVANTVSFLSAVRSSANFAIQLPVYGLLSA
jgi:hypothetical protein